MANEWVSRDDVHQGNSEYLWTSVERIGAAQLEQDLIRFKKSFESGSLTVR